jgi:hypothetical protein
VKNASVLVRGLAVLFVVAATAPYAIAAQPAGHRAVAIIELYLFMTAAMVVAWIAARRLQDAGARWIVVAGIAARILTAGVEPFTTHDVDRYLWDGRVLLEGLDPYATAPDDPAVAHLRENWPTPKEHARYPTVYPPAALALFAFAAGSGKVAAPWVWKLLVAGGSIALLLLLASLLRRRGLERHLALVALNPILVLEGGVGAHVDLLAAAAVAAALWLHDRAQFGRAGVALGAGALIKISPILAVLPLAVACDDRRVAGRLLGGAALSVGAVYGAVLALGSVPWGSTGAFFAGWRFGSPMGLLLAELPGAVPLLLGIAGLGAIGWLARGGEPWLAAFAALALPMLLGPVCFPWYLAVLVPLLAMRPTWFGIAWLAAAPLTYEVIDRFDATGRWEPARWPLYVLATAWLVGLAIDVLERWRPSGGTATR